MGYSKDYFTARTHHNSNSLQNFSATYEHNKPVLNTDTTQNKSEFNLFRMLMIPPAYIVSFEMLKFSTLIEDSNVFLQWFVDSSVTLGIVNSMTIIRYSDQPGTRNWNLFKLFVFYPVVWFTLVKEKLDEKKEERAK